MAEAAQVFIPADSLRLHRRPSEVPIEKKPDWLKVRAALGPNYTDLKALNRDLSLHTICEEAHCPNIFECWENRTATFLILGRVCTRACRFCAVETGKPTGLDLEEPQRVAEAVKHLKLRHVVVTSVARDDLPDGGGAIFAETIRAIRRDVPDCKVEVLIPDLQQNEPGLAAIVEARPDILNHNVETVQRLQKKVRAKARYHSSLWVLRRTKELDPGIRTKSGMMLGVGEERQEIEQTMADLRAIDVDILTLGQYLRPSLKHLPVERFVTPEEFANLKEVGLSLGFRHVESAPLVRSSYHAHEQTV
jgi:lipoyl synthase